MRDPLISFIILTRNRRKLLETAIESVREQRYPHREIIVVDNASTDGTDTFVRSNYPEVRVVSTERNVGSAAGRNRGIEASSGDVIILLDDDCILNSEHTARMVVEQFEIDEKCGAVAFRITDPHTWDVWPYNPDAPVKIPVVHEVGHFCTGGVALRRRVLEETGGFWEELFMGHVDAELSLRAVTHGWRIMRRNDLLVWHRAPDPRGSSDLRRAVYFRTRNSIWLAGRSMPVRMIPSLLAKTCVRALVMAVRTGSIPLFVRGVVDALRGLPKCLKLRRPFPRSWLRRVRRQHMRLWV